MLEVLLNAGAAALGITLSLSGSGAGYSLGHHGPWAELIITLCGGLVLPVAFLTYILPFGPITILPVVLAEAVIVDLIIRWVFPKPNEHRPPIQFNWRNSLIFLSILCVCFAIAIVPVIKHQAYLTNWTKLGSSVNLDASCDEEVTSLCFADPSVPI